MGRDPGIPVLRRQRRPLKLLLTLRPRRGPSAWEVVLLDGTLIPTRRRTGADNRKKFSGKHKRHGLRFLALTDTRGRLGCVHGRGVRVFAGDRRGVVK
ncbi:hypothetical protein [Nonomuraea dietziae]|uniref:hypothetical protein n=1 Tax=Nonomuraea dietziae TaxID=65515 RepID=UPI0031DBFD19